MTPDETALLERDLPSNLMYIPYYRWFASYLLHRDVSLDEMYAFFHAYYAKHRDPNARTWNDVERSLTPPRWSDYSR